MTKRAFWPALVIAGTLGVGILLGTLISHGVRADRPRLADAKPLGTPSAVELSSSFTRVADAVGPAVVNIKTQTDVRAGRHHSDNQQETLPDEEPFDGFFNRFFHFGGPPGTLPERSLGSGLVLDPAGYILTNCHVIMRDGGDQPVDRMRVILAGEDDTAKGHSARLVGYDKWTDLAVIKIDGAKPLAAASLGNS